MKFNRTQFYGMYPDGLILLDGYAFDVNGRQLIAHKQRPEIRKQMPGYHVSERTTGFSVPINPAKTHVIAAQYAVEQMKKVNNETWALAIGQAMAQRAKLHKVG